MYYHLFKVKEVIKYISNQLRINIEALPMISFCNFFFFSIQSAIIWIPMNIGLTNSNAFLLLFPSSLPFKHAKQPALRITSFPNQRMTIETLRMKVKNILPNKLIIIMFFNLSYLLYIMFIFHIYFFYVIINI